MERHPDTTAANTDPARAGPVCVLFLCTGNSCRSQMAQGWARALLGERVRALSAGTKPGVLNPLAVRVMREAGVDISAHTSKHVDTLASERIDLIVSVCDAASESCPALVHPARRLHRSFDDPPALARGAASEEEALAIYRRVRDEIRAFVLTLEAWH